MTGLIESPNFFGDSLPLREYLVLSLTTRFAYRRSASMRAASLRRFGVLTSRLMATSFMLSIVICFPSPIGYELAKTVPDGLL